MTQTSGKPAKPGNGGTRREELLKLAAEVFAERGYATATVRDLADAAGILSGSLYHHFESKDAILEEILRRTFAALELGYAEVLERDATTADVVRALLVRGFRFVEEFNAEIRILNNDYSYLAHIPRFEFVADHSRHLERTWLAALDRGVAAGEVRTDVDLRLVYRTMMASILAAVRWFDPSGSYSAEQLGSGTADVFLGSVLVEPLKAEASR